MTPDPDHLIERAAARLQTVQGLVVPEQAGGDAQRKEVVTPPPGSTPPSLLRLPPVPPPVQAPAPAVVQEPPGERPREHDGSVAAAPEAIAIPNVPESSASTTVSPPHASPPATAAVISLGELRRIGLVTADNGRSRISEEYRIIADRLRRNTGSVADRVIRNLVMVTSARPGEGKSFTALNLAASIALSKAGRAILVDADIGPNALTLQLGLKDRPGLHDLISDAKLRPDPFVLDTELPGFHILPLGHPARVRNGTMPYGAALERLTRRYVDSVIVLDTPPALSTSDPHAIAPHVAQVILVVEAERTQRSEVEAAFDLVRACPAVSAMLNKTRLSAGHTFGSRDGYYYAASA